MATLPYDGVKNDSSGSTPWGSVSSQGGTYRGPVFPFVNGATDYKRHVGATPWGTLLAQGGTWRAVPRHGAGISLVGMETFPMFCGGTFLGPSPTGSGIDATVGESAPSLRLAGGNAYSLRLRAAAGSRTVTARVLTPASGLPMPKMIIRANPEVGLNADVVVTATYGATWQTLSSGALTLTANGGLRVELWNTGIRLDVVCWWDKIDCK